VQQMEYSRGYLSHRSPREVPQRHEFCHKSEKPLTISGIGENTTGYLKAAVMYRGSGIPVTLNRRIALHEAENSKVADLS
jgi:hypothetical protein